jgi:hypothetical protein
MYIAGGGGWEEMAPVQWEALSTYLTPGDSSGLPFRK